MLALSVKQPWALMLAVGLKRVETRTWRPSPERVPEGTEFLLHASVTLDKGAMKYLAERGCLAHPLLGGLPKSHGVDMYNVLRKPVTGAIIARVKLVEVHRYWGEKSFAKHESLHLCPLDRYAPTKYGFEIKPIEVFSEPIPCRGYQGFFPVPEDVLARIPVPAEVAG